MTPCTCANPEGGRGQGVLTPLESDKNIGFLSNTGPDLLKQHIFQASIQYICLATIDPPVKRYLNELDPPLTKLSGSAHDAYAANIIILCLKYRND